MSFRTLVLLTAVVVTIMCITEVSSHSIATLSSPLDLNTFFNTVQSQSLVPTELRQSAASTSSATIPSTQNATTSSPTSSVPSIISQLLTTIGSVLTPALGPLSPLATIFGSTINTALTGLLTNGLTSLGGILRRNDLPNSNFETVMVGIPNQGSYILLIPKPEVMVVADPERNVDPKESTVNNTVQKMNQHQMQLLLAHQQNNYVNHQTNSREQDLFEQFRKEMIMMPLN